MVALTFVLLFVSEHRVNKILFLVIGGFLEALGAFLTGPSRLFELPNVLPLIRAGLIVSGVGKALLKSYIVAYTVKSGQLGFPEQREEAERKTPQLI